MLLLVDVMPLLYRGHFAFASRPRLTSQGVNTSAIFLFASSLQQWMSASGATHVALAMDTSPTFRHERFPAYKAQREKMPEEIAASIPMAEELARALRVPFLRVPGFEADDVIGTLAARADAAGIDVRIYTPDKDFAQLVTPRVTLCRPSKSDSGTEDYGPDAVRAHWDVPSPERIIDLLAMAGDSVDNIPGIQGVGEKTATRLLSEYGSLESVLAHAADIPGKLGERVREHAEDARLSYWLATIRRDAPVPESLDALAVQPPDLDALDAFLRRYELFALRKRYGLAPAEPAKNEASPVSDTSSSDPLFAFFTPKPEPRPTEKRPEGDSSSLGDLFDFFSPKPDAPAANPDEALAALQTAPLFAFAVETDGDAIRALSFALPAEGNGKQAPDNDLKEWSFHRPTDDVVRRFAPVFARDVPKVGYDVKRAMTALRRCGVTIAPPTRDLLLAHYVLDSAARHTLDVVAPAFLNGAPAGSTRAGTIARLDAPLTAAVREAGAAEALERCEDPLVPVLFDMEREGIRLDPAALADFSRELGDSIATLERRVHELAGEPFLLSSPRQLGHILFETLGLPPAGKTSTGQYETSEEVLQGLADKHPIVPPLLDWKARTKLKNTYVDKLPACVDPADGRIHTTFQQALTETGRLSSDNPNLQNIPVRTELGKRIRAAFVPRDADHVLLSADYSQIELRVLASLSGDEAMAEDFLKGSDIHAETAARVHGIPASEVTREMRTQAKRVNFGIVYGISAFGLGQRLGIPRKQAADLIAAVKAAYPGIDRFMERMVAEARTSGCARTLLGRRRPIRDISSRNGTLRAAAERLAVNTPVQGTAADIIKLAMVGIHGELRRRGLGARMVLQIHDELLFDVPTAEVETVTTLVRERMEGAISLAVPLVVDIGTGRTWLEAH